MNSRATILDAIHDLAQSVPADQISVKMILEASGVSRSTFYRHFGDRYDAVNAYFATRVRRLTQEGSDDLQGLTLRTLSLLRENRDYFARLRPEQGREAFLQFLQDHAAKLVAQTYVKSCDSRPEGLSYHQKAMVLFACAGGIELVRWWLEDDLRLPAEDVARELVGNMPLELRSRLG